MNKQRINELVGLVFLAIAILVLIGLISYNPDDIKFFTSSSSRQVTNFAGIVGAYIAWGLFFVLGWGAYIVPFLCFTWAINKFLGREPQKIYLKISGTIVLFLAADILLSMVFSSTNVMKVKAGGIIGLFLSDLLIKYFSKIGTYVVAIMLVIMSALLATEFLILPFIAISYKKLRDYIAGWRRPVLHRRKPRINIAQEKQVKKSPSIEIYKRWQPKVEPKITAPQEPKIIRPIIKPHIPPQPQTKTKPEAAKIRPQIEGGYKLPQLDLLDDPPKIEEKKIKEDLTVSSRILEETLQDFGIDVKVTQVEQGPTITRYELEPAPGVKVTRITSLSDDIALAMKAHSVRIVAPIPGKARVGVEVPNATSSLVYLKEVLQSNEFINSKSKLSLALGKDIAGEPVICDLGTMPHLLIAGTTGSGKTVCVNSIVLSMVFNASPDELKFILIDPKMVELAMFNRLPHLLFPVLTEPKKVSAALNYVVEEMESRYRLLAKVGTRNIEAFNQKSAKEKFSESQDAEKIPDKLPYIVVVIDELADLMAIASQDIESAITRLAQLSRAVGIHMILATQRPSVDVITGVIKANFPARISFKVASKVDSRTVLDMNGADKLLGRGDMLFIEPGTAKPLRAQASLVSDKEIERVIDFVSSQIPAQYEDELLNMQEGKKSYNAEEEDDLFEEAVKMVLESGLASVSLLQRRMKLGHMRAARLIDAMEEKGIVGPYQGSKPRDILIDREAYLREKIQENKA